MAGSPPTNSWSNTVYAASGHLILQSSFTNKDTEFHPDLKGDKTGSCGDIP